MEFFHFDLHVLHWRLIDPIRNACTHHVYPTPIENLDSVLQDDGGIFSSLVISYFLENPALLISRLLLSRHYYSPP